MPMFVQARKKLVSIFLFGALIAGVNYSWNDSYAKSKTESSNHVKAFEITAIEKEGKKYWIPADIKVKKGDTVKLHLVSKIPGANNIHGFKISEYNIELLVDGKGKDAEFVADKAGEFKIFCHLHPAHVGGKLVVE